ncbi:MAG TPA: sigma-70 family RNA polymerase sigma factor [Candidatus Pacearchaeota archaeon]|nr:sigma-70 family RNA polymerase sigma factor [Candidatus Pacearchaeota archaeon]
MSNLKKEFSKIYDKYINQIYRFVFLKVNSKEIAEDITSETFLKVWESYKNNKIENVSAFLYQVARNLLTDYYRQKSRTQFLPLDSVSIIDPSNNLKEESQDKSDIETIKSALFRLENENYQNIIIWHYLNDLSIKEISKINNQSEGAVRVMLSRALKELKEIIENDNKIEIS